MLKQVSLGSWELEFVRTIIAALIEQLFSCSLSVLDLASIHHLGDVKEDAYMMLPQGISSSKPNQVCKLRY